MKIKRIRYHRKKIFIFLFLFLFLVGIGVGFAFVTTKLDIEGIVHVKDAKWDVHFTNFQAMQGSVEPVSDPTVTNTNVTFSAKLDEPGDFYGFTVDVTNQGTINADISNISLTPDFSTIDYIDATVAYNNDNPIQIGDILAAGKTKTIKVLLKYKEGIDDSLYPTQNQTFNVTLTLDYEQYIGEVVLDANFATDSWDKIIAAYKGGALTQLTEDMNNGTTREVELDLDNDGTAETTAHLRIANLSSPAECDTEGFSQTACGFVLEFADIITTHRMNPFTDGTTNGDSNKGGWEYSEMRTYLNTDIYNALPNELSSKIKDDTTVVSGHGSNDTENFTTTDKIYLFSPHEVWEDVDENTSSGIDYYDKSYSNTRQLDYYKAKGVTTSNYSGAIKKRIDNGNSYYWWLRSASSNNYGSFLTVRSNGSWTFTSSDTDNGVSPAFRIA